MATVNNDRRILALFIHVAALISTLDRAESVCRRLADGLFLDVVVGLRHRPLRLHLILTIQLLLIYRGHGRLIRFRVDAFILPRFDILFPLLASLNLL